MAACLTLCARGTNSVVCIPEGGSLTSQVCYSCCRRCRRCCNCFWCLWLFSVGGVVAVVADTAAASVATTTTTTTTAAAAFDLRLRLSCVQVYTYVHSVRACIHLYQFITIRSNQP